MVAQQSHQQSQQQQRQQALQQALQQKQLLQQYQRQQQQQQQHYQEVSFSSHGDNLLRIPEDDEAVFDDPRLDRAVLLEDDNSNNNFSIEDIYNDIDKEDYEHKNKSRRYRSGGGSSGGDRRNGSSGSNTSSTTSTATTNNNFFVAIFEQDSDDSPDKSSFHTATTEDSTRSGARTSYNQHQVVGVANAVSWNEDNERGRSSRRGRGKGPIDLDDSLDTKSDDSDTSSIGDNEIAHNAAKEIGTETESIFTISTAGGPIDLDRIQETDDHFDAIWNDHEDEFLVWKAKKKDRAARHRHQQCKRRTQPVSAAAVAVATKNKPGQYDYNYYSHNTIVENKKFYGSDLPTDSEGPSNDNGNDNINDDSATSVTYSSLDTFGFRKIKKKKAAPIATNNALLESKPDNFESPGYGKDSNDSTTLVTYSSNISLNTFDFRQVRKKNMASDSPVATNDAFLLASKPDSSSRLDDKDSATLVKCSSSFDTFGLPKMKKVVADTPIATDNMPLLASKADNPKSPGNGNNNDNASTILVTCSSSSLDTFDFRKVKEKKKPAGDNTSVASDDVSLLASKADDSDSPGNDNTNDIDLTTLVACSSSGSLDTFDVGKVKEKKEPAADNTPVACDDVSLLASKPDNSNSPDNDNNNDDSATLVTCSSSLDTFGFRKAKEMKAAADTPLVTESLASKSNKNYYYYDDDNNDNDFSKELELAAELAAAVDDSKRSRQGTTLGRLDTFGFPGVVDDKVAAALWNEINQCPSHNDAKFSAKSSGNQEQQQHQSLTTATMHSHHRPVVEGSNSIITIGSKSREAIELASKARQLRALRLRATIHNDKDDAAGLDVPRYRTPEEEEQESPQSQQHGAAGMVNVVRVLSNTTCQSVVSDITTLSDKLFLKINPNKPQGRWDDISSLGFSVSGQHQQQQQQQGTISTSIASSTNYCEIWVKNKNHNRILEPNEREGRDSNSDSDGDVLVMVEEPPPSYVKTPPICYMNQTIRAQLKQSDNAKQIEFESHNRMESKKRDGQGRGDVLEKEPPPLYFDGSVKTPPMCYMNQTIRTQLEQNDNAREGQGRGGVLEEPPLYFDGSVKTPPICYMNQTIRSQLDQNDNAQQRHNDYENDGYQDLYSGESKWDDVSSIGLVGVETINKRLKRHLSKSDNNYPPVPVIPFVIRPQPEDFDDISSDEEEGDLNTNDIFRTRANHTDSDDKERKSETTPTFSALWAEDSSDVENPKGKILSGSSIPHLELNPTFSTVWVEDCDSYYSNSSTNFSDQEMQHPGVAEEKEDQVSSVVIASDSDGDSEETEVLILTKFNWIPITIIITVVVAGVASVAMYVNVGV